MAVKPKSRTLLGWFVRATVITLLLAAVFFQGRFSLGLDEQPNPCLGHHFYLVDKRPAESSPVVGQCYAFDLWVKPLKNNGLDYVEKRRFAKRLAAGPGDEVEITKEGKLLVNGICQRPSMPLLEKINAKPSDYAFKRTLGKDEYFFLGDTATSYDSRYWGTVKQKQIKGKIICGFF